MNPSTVEIWRGPSEIDGAPIVLLASGLGAAPSSNRKTGPMIQTWILRQDQSPVDAVRTGADVAICGSCPHRGTDGFSGRSCYVNVGQAPSSIWRAWRRGSVPTVPHDPALAIVGPDGILGYVPQLRRALRLGAYGDPLAVPFSAWSPWLNASMGFGHTGYTHQWSTIGRRHPDWRHYVMASVDTAAEAMLARALGWRTFRVHAAADPAPLGREIECVAVTHGRTCADCQLCNGAHPFLPSIRIGAHGAGAAHVAGR